MNKEEIKQRIKELKQRIPKIKNRQIRLQQQKYMHRLEKELKVYNFYRGEKKCYKK